MSDDSLRMETKKAELLNALQANDCLVTQACKDVGIDRSRYYDYMKKDPDFAAAVKAIPEKVVDMVEAAAYKQIRDGNTTMIIFFLKTKGKHRGWTENQTITHRVSSETVESVGELIKLHEKEY